MRKTNSTSELGMSETTVADVELVVAKAVKVAVSVVCDTFEKLLKDMKEHIWSLEEELIILNMMDHNRAMCLMWLMAVYPLIYQQHRYCRMVWYGNRILELVLHYWMRGAHHCSGPPSPKWPILCRVGPTVSHSTQYRSFWRRRPWAVMCTSHSVMEGQRHNPLNPHCFCLQWPKRDAVVEAAKALGGSFKLVMLAPKIVREMTQLLRET